MAKKVSKKVEEEVTPLVTPTEQVSEPVEEIEEEQPLVVEEPKPEQKVEVVMPQPAVKAKEPEEVPVEERIMKYIESRMGGEVKLNDFIKSLYPMPTVGNPPAYLSQGESKKLKAILTGMVGSGLLRIKGNAHLLLGQFYHEPVDQRTCHRSIKDVDLFVEK